MDENRQPGWKIQPAFTIFGDVDETFAPGHRPAEERQKDLIKRMENLRPLPGGLDKADWNDFVVSRHRSLDRAYCSLEPDGHRLGNHTHIHAIPLPSQGSHPDNHWIVVLSGKGSAGYGTMSQAVLKGDPSVEIHLRRSSRAKRISLRVSEFDGRVTLTVPETTDVSKAFAFAEEKSDWIRKQLSRRVTPIAVGVGATIPVNGQEVVIESGPVRRAEIRDGRLVVPNPPDMAAARVKAFLKISARSVLAELCQRYSGRLARPYGKITLRDTRSRWGSCSTQGDLMFSWRLAMAPREVLDYVAAHEVAHLAEMNHSSAYWAVVARICPGYAGPRAWLKENGRKLHRYRFED